MNSFVKKYKTQLKNLSYLTLLKGLTLLLPLFTFPYLIHILGSVNYGLVMWAWAFADIFIVLINFGFDTLGIKLVSEKRDSVTELSIVFSKITSIKVVIFSICSLVFFMMLKFTDYFKQHEIIFILFYCFAFFEAMQPFWFFQGIEKMNIMAILVSFTKIIFSLLVFIFIKNENDFLLVPILYVIGSIFSNIISYILIFKRYHVRIHKFKLHGIFEIIIESSFILLSNIGSVIRDRGTVILIERYIGLSAVAFFDISMKIVNIILTPYHIISQVLYPYVAKTRDISIVRKVIWLILGTSILLISIIHIEATTIATFFDKKSAMEIGNIIKMLVFIIPLGAISALIGTNVLIVYKKTHWLTISLVLSTLAYSLFILGFPKNNLETFVYAYILFFLVDMLIRFFSVRKQIF